MEQKYFDYAFAIRHLMNGKPVSRNSWQGTLNKFVYKSHSTIIPKDAVDKMTSLPDDVKNVFKAIFDDSNEQIAAIYFCNQFHLVRASNVVDSWAPSADDMAAEDWFVYEHIVE